MMRKDNYIKLIFGLKIKQLRNDRRMSLSELSSKSGMSVSYLNEIESGKKYPKTDKIAALSEALETDYDKLVSLKMARNLAPIGELLDTNILEQLPLDHYGIDINKLIMLMAGSSVQLSALIATFIEMAQSSESSQNNFSKTALRTFKEFNDNYFEDLENAAESFIDEFKLKTIVNLGFGRLKQILEDSYKYKIDEDILNSRPQLSVLRAVVMRNKKTMLLLNNKLSDAQKAFIAGKELAYNYLNIKDRSYIHSSLQLKTFDQLLNNFKASYFSTAVLINRNFLIAELDKFFKAKKWDDNRFLKIINRYNCTTEMFFQRITNIQSKYFGLNKFFFLRFNHEIGTPEFRLSNELRLNTRRNPGASLGNENFCRRWVSFKTLNNIEAKIKNDKNFYGRTANICRSKFFDSQDEYVCISVGQRGNLFPNMISSITIGFQIDESLKDKISFTADPSLPQIIVNETCERCKIQDCKERAAPPVSARRIEKYERVLEALSELEKDYKNAE